MAEDRARASGPVCMTPRAPRKPGLQPFAILEMAKTIRSLPACPAMAQLTKLEPAALALKSS